MLRKQDKLNRQKRPQLKFTGERLIPEINKGTAFFYEHIARYIFAMQAVKNKVVLDAGCGTGYGSYILSKYGGAQKIYAADVSEDSIEYAKRNYRLKNIVFAVDNVETLESIPHSKIDVAVAFEIIEHVSKYTQFLYKIKSCLKQDGLFFVSTPNKYAYPKGNPFHTKEFYPNEFARLIQKFFKYTDMYHQCFEVAQMIKTKKNVDFIFEESFSLLDQIAYTPPLDTKESQYFLAVCSNKPLAQLRTITITTKKVDNVNVEKGLLNLELQLNEVNMLRAKLKQKTIRFYKDYKEKKKLAGQADELQKTLNTIKSSKFFKVWQTYCRVRDSIFKNQ